MRVSGVPGASVLTLAFAYSFIAILGTIALIAHFEHRFGGLLKRVWWSWLQSALSSLAGGASTYLVLNFAGPITLSSTVLTVFLKGFLGGAIGIAVCALVYSLLNSRE